MARVVIRINCIIQEKRPSVHMLDIQEYDRHERYARTQVDAMYVHRTAPHRQDVSQLEVQQAALHMSMYTEPPQFRLRDSLFPSMSQERIIFTAIFTTS